MRTKTTFTPGRFGARTAQALKVVADAERGISRHKLAQVMGVKDSSASKYLTALLKAGAVRKLGANTSQSVCYCTPENVPATMERLEVMRYGTSTGRHMTDDDFEEWVRVVNQKLTSSKDAPPVVTNAPRSIFEVAEAMA